MDLSSMRSRRFFDVCFGVGANLFVFEDAERSVAF